MGMMKREYWDNIVPIRPDVEVGVAVAESLDNWWVRARDGLKWRSIATYERLDPDLALASPVVLRNGEEWHLGAWTDGEWHEVTEGGSWRLEGFEPTQWAEPTMADFILLHRHG
jgi:hypothetical protein